MPDVLACQWRTGRSLGRTVYAMAGEEPGDGDALLGLMDSPELAERVVRDHNEALA